MGLESDYGRFIFANPLNFTPGRGLTDFVASKAKRWEKEKSVDMGMAQWDNGRR